MNKNNKKFLIIGIIAIVLVIFVIGFFILNKKTNKNENNDNNINYSENKDEGLGLPDLKTISSEIDPEIYDFLNGSIGLNSSNYLQNVDTCNNFFAILFNEESIKNNKIWISYYKFTEPFPALGSNIEYYKIPEQSIETFNNEIANIKLDSNSLCYFNYDDKKYTLALIYSYDNINSNVPKYDINGYFGGFNLTNEINNLQEYGNEYSIINEQGWPTQWLRNCSYKEILQKKYLINSDFWDRYQLFSIEQYKNINNENVYIYCEGYNRFKITIGNGEIETIDPEISNGFISNTYYLKEDDLKLFKQELK